MGRLLLVFAMLGVLFAGVYLAGGWMARSQTTDQPPPGQAGQAVAVDNDLEESKRAKKERVAKTRWVRDTNALCRRAERETSRLKWPTTADKAEDVVAELDALHESYRADLASLEPVKADRRKFAKVRALFAKDARLIDEYLSAIRSQQAPRSFLDVLFRLDVSGGKESALLYELGATRCGAAFSAPYP